MPPEEESVDANAAADLYSRVAAVRAAGGTGSVAPPSGTVSAEAGGGGISTKVYPRTEEYAYVTRSDLRELQTIGWLHQSLIGLGTFFSSGAFWLAIGIISQQPKVEFTAWLGMCLISIVAGGALAAVGLILFAVKQKKLAKYFPED